MRTADLVRSTDIFADLDSDDLAELCYGMHERVVRAGEELCSRTEPYDAMFIVVEGEVRVDEQRLTAGAAWGEIGLISGQPTRCEATANTDSHLLELDRDAFDAFVAARPGAMRSILAAISRRAIQTNQRLLSDETRDISRGPAGSVFAVFSTRGGAGKTLLASRLALELARRNPRHVALFDLDLLFDDAAFELGVEAVTPGAEEQHNGLTVIAAAPHPEDGERLTATQVRNSLAGFKRQFAATVVDCGNSYSEPTLAALETAERVLVVCTPELSTLRDLREMQRLFGQALHLGKQRVSFVLNHPLPVTGLTRQQFEGGLEQKMLAEIEHAGEEASRPKFAKAISALADELVPPASRHSGVHLPFFGRR